MLLIEDRALLEAYRAGRPEALGRVFDHYHPLVVRLVESGFSFRSGGYAMRFAGYQSSADVFDLVHDVFRAAFEEPARRGYGGTSPFAAYIATIARNLVLSRLRRQKVIPESGPLELAEALQAPAPSPEEAAVTAQEREGIRSFLGTLTAEEREFTRLRFEEELSQEAVAEAMTVGRKKVRILEERVRDRLNRFMKQRDPGATAASPPSPLVIREET